MGRPDKISGLMSVIRVCIEEGRYLDTRHAFERQVQREITRPEVLYVLKRGHHEKKKDQYDDFYQAWNYAIKGSEEFMETKIQAEFIDTEFGFPVQLLNVPMVKVRGHWTPKLNYNGLADAVLLALSSKDSRLTGNEIKFIRTHFEATLQEFATRFSVSHVAVLKWEKAKDAPTLMNWATEKDIRLFILDKLRAKPVVLAKLYSALAALPEGKSKPISLDAKKVAA